MCFAPAVPTLGFEPYKELLFLVKYRVSPKEFAYICANFQDKYLVSIATLTYRLM